MAEAILSLSPNNGWSSRLRLVDKRRAHWILQLLGSGLALGGSFLKILDKNVHWNTLHGQFGKNQVFEVDTVIESISKAILADARTLATVSILIDKYHGTKLLQLS